ncbi:MAG: hypothetical protein CME62_03430 [Halobacteriovoraceae bacterium]|nr:hypothetical protein [Halobacteriovoraceae bacterium]|tara:strand:- start:36552 stop:37484 length:933 start_codon:yes stop_codon:yes gene_type:complete
MKSIDLGHYQSLFCKKLADDGKSFNTIKNYRTDLNIFMQFLAIKGQKSVITAITHEQLKEYNKYLSQKYSSPNSIRRRIQALRMFFDYLVAQNIYPDNPVKKMLVSPKVVDLPNPPEFHVIKAVFESLNPELSHKHFDKLLNLRNRVLIQLIYGGGLKVSHIENLRAEHIQLYKKEYRILVAPEKRDPFTISMPKEFNSLHLEYSEALLKQKQKDDIDFSHYLFNGNPYRILSGGLSARGIEVIFKEYSRLFDIQLTAKNIRQACIFKWLGQDRPEARIKEWMGVQPQYSLKPYRDLLELQPNKYCYLEL